MDTTRPDWLTDPTWGKRAQQLLGLLPEHHRRWLAGLLSLQAGRGGDRWVSEALGLHEDTVRRGKHEVEAGLDNRPPNRVRLPGGGRPRVEDSDPTIVAHLGALVEPETAGDPCSRQKWTRKSLRQLAKKLQAKGHSAGPDTVSRLLKKMGTR
jgi:hypothetical protein